MTGINGSSLSTRMGFRMNGILGILSGGGATTQTGIHTIQLITSSTGYK